MNVDQVKAIKQERYSIKINKLQQLMKWVHSNGCRRKRVMTYFNEILLDSPVKCCDICKINLDDFQEKKKVDHNTVDSSWEKRLQQLLLLESGLQ
nr:RecQ family zinc-binding domain-containing protein [Lederbergia citrisecunda]